MPKAGVYSEDRSLKLSLLTRCAVCTVMVSRFYKTLV